MILSEIKEQLKTIDTVTFQLPNGTLVPKHFHVTEVGVITKDFIDCGGTIRQEKVVNFQLWEAADYDHLLAPQKLLNIIALSEKALGLEDLEVEVEYQADTIGKYNLGFENGLFTLFNKQTNCLATDKCGIPAEKLKVSLSDLQNKTQSCCAPGNGCC